MAGLRTAEWRKLRVEILRRDQNTCYLCGTPEANEVDHIWPRSKGGDMFDPLNCAAICRACNLAKGDRFFSPAPTPPVFSGFSVPKSPTAATIKAFACRFETITAKSCVSVPISAGGF